MPESITCISPVDGSVHASRPAASKKDIEAAFSRAHAAQDKWKRLPISERAAYCSAAVDAALTWTGAKNTGRGATLSVIGYEALTRPKSYHLRTRTS